VTRRVVVRPAWVAGEARGRGGAGHVTGFKSPAAEPRGRQCRASSGAEEARAEGQRGSWKMADEVALALQAAGSPSAAAAMEAASQPADEPLRKRPRRDGPGLGRSPGEPSAAVAPAAAGCEAASAAAPAALWREAAGAAASAEREAPATAVAGDGDNGSGLRREPRAADDFDDDEGEEEDEAAAAAAAAAIGYRGESARAAAQPRPSASPPVTRSQVAQGPESSAGSAAAAAAAAQLGPGSAARRRARRPCCGAARGLAARLGRLALLRAVAGTAVLAVWR
jgi:hypothetical protein